MGFSLKHPCRRTHSKINMKTFICLFALWAAASAVPEAKPEAEADPYLLYSGYGGYPGYGYAGYRRFGYAGYPYGGRFAYAHHYGKREATAEPEAEAKADADPCLLYSGLGGYPGYGYGYGRSFGYAGYPYGARYAYGGYPYAGVYAHHYGKREATAEPEAAAEANADADPYLFYSGYGAGYAHPYGYSGYYNRGFGYGHFGGYPYARASYYGGYPYAYGK